MKKRWKNLARDAMRLCGDSPRAAVFYAIGFHAWIDEAFGMPPANALGRRALIARRQQVEAWKFMRRRHAQNQS